MKETKKNKPSLAYVQEEKNYGCFIVRTPPVHEMPTKRLIQERQRDGQQRNGACTHPPCWLSCENLNTAKEEYGRKIVQGTLLFLIRLWHRLVKERKNFGQAPP